MFIKYLFNFFKSNINAFYILFKIKNFFNKQNYYFKKKLLICEMGGFKYLLLKNIIIAWAMRFRGYDSHFIICDGLPEACMQRNIKTSPNIKQWKNKCSNCFGNMQSTLNKFGLNYSKPSDYIDEHTRNKLIKISNELPLHKIKNYKYQSVDVGKIAFSSLKRFFLGRLDNLSDINSRKDKTFYRKYFYASLVNTFVAKNFLNFIKPNSFLCSHGIYVDFKPSVTLSLLKNLPTLVWFSGYFSNFFYYFYPSLKNKDNAKTINSNLYKNLKIDNKKKNKINNFFILRYKSNKTKFRHDLPLVKIYQHSYLQKKLLLNKNYKTICLFPSINWDPPITASYGKSLYNDMNNWVADSINIMNTVTNVNWIIKIHPSEKLFDDHYGAINFLKKKYNLQKLSKNIQIINSSENINSLDFYNIIDHGITCYGTIGLELPVLGKSTIVVGPAHYQHKGFTIDINSKSEYFYYLRNPYKIPMLKEKQKIIAMKYFYYYIYIKQISFPFFTKRFSFIEPKESPHLGEINSHQLKNIFPKKNSSIEKICNYLEFKKKF
jgi:hypothetical protein